MVHELTECPCKLISIMLFVLCPWDIICVWTGLVLFLMIWWKQASKWDMLLLNGQNLLQILRSRKRKCTEVKVLLWQLNTLLNRKTSLRIKYCMSSQYKAWRFPEQHFSSIWFDFLRGYVLYVLRTGKQNTQRLRRLANHLVPGNTKPK